MPKALAEVLEEGVIYHAFSDCSGVAIYSTFSNEVFVTSESLSSLLTALGNSTADDEQQRIVKTELVKKGFIKSEWH